MNFGRLYDFSDASKRTALRVETYRDLPDPAAIYRGEICPAEAIVFKCMKGASGSTPYDLIATGHASLGLVSDRMVKILKSFTGWKTYPVEMYGKKGERILGYHGLVVTGRAGAIEDRRSEPRICPPPVPQGRWSRQWFGLYFDAKTWDGSDLFIPEGTGMAVVVEAVKEAMDRAKVTNVEFRALTECRNASVPLELL